MQRGRLIAAGVIGGLLAVGLMFVVFDAERHPTDESSSARSERNAKRHTTRTGSGSSGGGDDGGLALDFDAEPGTPGSPFSPAPTWIRPRPPLPEPPPFGAEVLAEHAAREPAKWRSLSKALRAEGLTSLSERSRRMAARVQESANLEKDPRDSMLYDEQQIIVDIRAANPPEDVLELTNGIEQAVHALMQGGAHPDTIDPKTGVPRNPQ